MDCNEIQPLLGGFLDEELPEADCKTVAHHLERCAKCATKLNQVRQIERVLQQGLFDSPPDEYWAELPAVVTARLGLAPQAPQTLFERLQEYLGRLVPYRGLAIAGGLAVLVAAFVLVTRYGRREAEPSRLSQVTASEQPAGQATAPMVTSEKTIPAHDPVASASTKPHSGTPQQTTASDAQARSAPRTDSPVRNVEIGRAAQNPFAAVSPESLPPRLRRSHKPPTGFSHILYPRPPLELVIAQAGADEQDPGHSPRSVQALSFGGAQAGQGLTESDGREEMARLKSRFEEIKWIVEQSPSLGEKKNIWLSYLSREQDPTYRALAVYNLAVVLAKIAKTEETRKSAKEALEFFTKNEESLRAQMGDHQFEVNLKTLNQILGTN